MIKYFKMDVQGVNHAIKVFSFARLIGKVEGLDDSKQQILEIAAILYYKIENTDFKILVEINFIVNIYKDEISKDAIRVIKEKYFKTKTGIRLI